MWALIIKKTPRDNIWVRASFIIAGYPERYDQLYMGIYAIAADKYGN